MRVNLKLGFFIIGLITLVQSCKHHRQDYFKIKSLDGKNCISIVDRDTVRYIITGEFPNEIPNSNYVKLDLKLYDFDYDEISICWNNENNKCELSMEYIDILENKLDTSKYVFYNYFPWDRSIERKADAINQYLKKSTCFSVDLFYQVVISEDEAILETN